MDLGYKDKAVIVTGGTKGIGEGIVRILADEGAKVVMVNRQGKEGPAIVEELTQKGQTVHYIAAELTKVDECERVIKEAMEVYGRIDSIFNNAGYNNELDLLTPPEEFLKGMEDKPYPRLCAGTLRTRRAYQKQGLDSEHRIAC
jgi:NAD(P)-dependent dehydrogenase (short-subunit alcohol dehydrogenase family)